MGGAEYARLGTDTSTGTKLVSVSGHVQRPGNYEIELGLPSREIIPVSSAVPGGTLWRSVLVRVAPPRRS